MPIEAEALNAAVFAVGDIDDSVPIDGDPVRQVELAPAGSGRAPFADSFARGVVFQDPCIGVPIGNKDASAGGEGDVRCAAELAPRRNRKPADTDFNQLLALAGELVDRGAGRVGGPDIAGGIHPDAVRNLVEAFAPGAKDAALTGRRQSPGPPSSLVAAGRLRRW